MKVIVIKPNKFAINMNSNECTSEFYLNTMIKKCSSVVEIENKNLMQFIVDQTGMVPEKLGNTSTIYQDDKEIIQMCHFDENEYVNQGRETKDDQINGLASTLSMENILIGGNVVIMRFNFTDDYHGIESDMSITKLTELLYRRIHKRGVVITENGDIKEMTFKFSPVEIMGNKASNFATVECPFYKLNFEGYFEINPEKMILNETASRMVGQPVFGKFILCKLETDLIFGDLSKDIAEKICFVTSRIPILKRNLDENDEIDDHDENGYPVMFNGYHILKNKYKECSSMELSLINPKLLPMHLIAKEKLNR